jgi:hypothetical protein
MVWERNGGGYIGSIVLNLLTLKQTPLYKEQKETAGTSNTGESDESGNLRQNQH